MAAAEVLDEIERGATDQDVDLPTLLRKCLQLGGATGSVTLREWAAHELKGYDGDVELPTYRQLAGALLMDGVVGYNRVQRQQVPATLIPEGTRDVLAGLVKFPSPLAEIEAQVASHRSTQVPAMKIGVPGSDLLLPLMNAELGQGAGPSQVIDRIYWAVSVESVAGISDVVRTTLVELVSEMRAGTPRGQDVTPAIAEQAALVAIQGNKNRVTVVSNSPGAAAASGGAASAGGPVESRGRAVMYWIVGVAGVIAACAGVWALFLR